jgi:predicted amidohydrolase YtcJ
LRSRIQIRALFALAVFAAGSVLADPVPATRAGVLVNARIHTLDESRPIVEALAWDASGRITAVGSRATVLSSAPDATVHDARGATVVPGLIDAHAHLMGLGLALMSADLVGTRSKNEVIARLQAFAESLPPVAWLVGRGWDQNDWPEKSFPTAADLDAVFPARPVWLERIDGHAGWANAAAMRRVARDLDGDWQPEGGRIVRDGTKPTGVFVDAAMDLVNGVVPPPDRALRSEALKRALASAASVGLTSVHDMGTSAADLELFEKFADEGRLTLRVVAYADGDSTALDDRCRNGPFMHPSGRVRMAGVKFYSDGALGSRGAALIEPYSDDPDNRGILVAPPDKLLAGVQKAQRCGMQVATHAIGDRGNRLVLDAYAQVLGEKAARDHRWRIEHAQVVSPALTPGDVSSRRACDWRSVRTSQWNQSTRASGSTQQLRGRTSRVIHRGAGSRNRS